MLPPPGSLPGLHLEVPSPLRPQCPGVHPPITECIVPAYFLIYSHELHEGLYLIYHVILHHLACGLLQRNVYEVGGIIAIIIIITTIIIIPFPILDETCGKSHN